MNTPRKHGPLAIRLVGFYGMQGPTQLNVVCTHCLSMTAFNHPAQIIHFADSECPSFVMVQEPVKETGDFDYARLLDELEKRRQL